MLAGRRRLLALGIAALAVALLPTAASSRQTKELLYKVEVTATNASGTHRSLEYVLAYSRMWRVEEGERLYLFTNRIGSTSMQTDKAYGEFDPATGFSVRIGSERFLSAVPQRSLTAEAVRAYATGKAAEHGVDVTRLGDGRAELRFRNRGFDIVATVSRDDPFHTSRAFGLFTIPPEKITTMTTELWGGRGPVFQNRAYWFGMKLGRRELVTVVEHMEKRPESRFLFTLFYELPSAGHRSSAYPGQAAPPGELRVVTQPRATRPVQRALRSLNGVRGLRVKLRSGEKATVIAGRGSFSVVTRRSLVTVEGTFAPKDIAPLARRLRVLA